jgi:hypothetical protein
VPGAARTWIAARDLNRVRRAIEALSERGRRFGTGPIALRELERRDGKVLVELSGEPPRLEGWEVVGRLDHRDGGPGRIAFASRGVDHAAWSGARPWCEHCGLLRRRTVTYLVRRRGGEIRQIGSSCLRDYTGHDLARVVRQAELIRKGRAAVRRSARNLGPSSGLHPMEDQWKEGAFLGPVGARVEAKVEVKALRAVGHNRFGDVVWHGMRDERDRWVSWFASGGRRLRRGRRYRLRGTVRRYGEWRGRPVTVLTRCRAESISADRDPSGFGR